MSRVGREPGESPSSRQENFSPKADDDTEQNNDSEQNNDKASQRLLTEANRGLDLGFLISRKETNNTPQESATSEHLGLAKKLLGKDIENILQIDSASGKPQSKNPLVQEYFERQEAGDQKAAERALLRLGHEANENKSPEAKSALAALQLVEAMSKLQKGASADDIHLSQRGLTELAKLAKPGNTAEFILDNYANGTDGHNPLRDAQVKWARTAAQGGDDAVSAAAEKSFTQVLNPAGAEAKTKALIDLTIANYTLSPEARREQAPLMHLAQALDTASAIDETIQKTIQIGGHPNQLEKSLNMALKLGQSGNQPAAEMLNAIGVHSKADAHNLVQLLSRPGGRALTDLQSNLRDWQSGQGYSTAPRDMTPTASTEKIYQDFFKNPNIPDNVKEKIDSPAILRVPPGSADLRDLAQVHKDDVHTRNDILTRHYLSGDQNARQAALDGLRREVQQGNLSAMQRLTELSLFDGSLKLADANRRVNQAQDPVAQQKAIEDQQQALTDLAIMELGDKKRQSGISDLLDHAPAMGVSKAEIDQARRQAASEEKAQTELVTKVLDQAIRGTTNGDKNNGGTHGRSTDSNQPNRDALSQLEQVDSEPESTAKMVSKYLSGSGQENRRVAEFAHGTRDAKELAEALDNPERAAAALRKIDRLARHGNTTADGIMRSLNSDQTSQDMMQALKKGNEKTFQENLQKPEVVEAIRRALEPSLKLSQELKIVKAEDLLKAFADPAALETAREAARKFSKGNFDSADQALANFSKRDQSGEQRQEALNALLEASDKRLKHFNDYAFEGVRLNLESIDAAKRVHEAISKTAQSSENEGYAQVASALKDLQKIAYDGNHNLAHRYLNNLRGDNQQFNIDDLTKRLESGDKQALADIAKHLPNGEGELNDYRANRIVRNLGPDSSLEALTTARQQLEDEVKQDKGNQNAQEWLKWTSSAQNVSQLSLAASNKDLPAAEKAIAELSLAANNGDGFARASLAAILLGRSDTQGKAVFESAGFGKTQDKPTYIANLKGLPAAEAEQLMLKAINGLEHALTEGSEEKSKMLTVEEAGTLAVALVQAKAESETSNSADKPMASAKVAAAIESALNKAIDGPSRSNVMESIFNTIRHELPGANHLSSLYIKGSASDPILAKHFDSLAQWARLGDDASLSILAGITSGAADNNSVANPLSYVGQGQDEKPIYRAKDSIADKARNILSAVSEQADKQEKVIESLIAVYEKAGDKNQLLSTLGAIAAKVENAPVEKVRAALHKGIENTRDISYSKETESSDSKAHRSAVAGLMSMAKNWNQADTKLVQEHLTPTMISGLRKSAGDVPEAQRHELATALQEKLTSKDTDAKANGERLGALKALGSLGQSLDREQVKEIASFGGKSGLDKLSRLGINGEAAIEFQAQSGKALLRVVSLADNARPGREGPREIAYKAFKDNAWPNLDSGNGEHQSVIDSSGKTREPRDLREALLNYAEGRPFDISLSKEISRIVYDAGLKRPPAGILQDWGVPSENPDALFVKADRIVSNYTSKESGGEEVLKRVASNIDLVNSLPPDLRLKVTGNQEPIDKAQVAGQMLNATLSESRNKALLEDLPKQLAGLSLAANKEVTDLTKEHTTLRREQSHNLAALSDHTKEGVSFGRRITSVFGDDTIDKFEEKQVGLVKQLPVFNIKTELKAQELSEAGQKKHVLDLAIQIGNHTDLENKGRQKEADQLALSMWQEHGAMLQKLAPTVWRDLVASDGQQVGRSALGRLKDASLGQFDTVPNYDSGSKGFKEALKTLEDIKYKQVTAPEGFTYTAEFADTAAMRAHALHRLSDDNAFRGLDKVSKTFNQALPELTAMVDAAQKGTKFDTFVASAQDKAAMLKNAMNSVTKEELAEVRERITSMQEAADRMKANKADSNPEALAGLNARIATYKQMHDMLNPEPSANFNPDKNVNGQLKTLIDKVTDPNFKPDTFANWAKTNGPVIAATVVAVAATVAACATFGVSSPLAVAAWASVAGLAASELTKEGLYQVNSNLGYSGFGVYGERSKAGAWSAKIGERDGWENVKTFVTEVAGPYAGQIAFDTALAFGTMGISKFALSGFSAKTLSTESMKQLIVGEGKSMAQLAAQSERAALMAQGDSTAAHFMRDYMKNLGKEVLINSGFTAAQMSLEKGIEAVTPEQLKSMVHEGNTGVSFGISTSLAIGQGLLASLRHGKGGKINFEAKTPEGEKAFIEFYRKEGFDVKPILAPGESKAARWEVRSFNQLQGQPPFVLERGTGLPEKDLFPGGAKTVAKVEGAKKVELPIEVEAHGEKWRQTEAGQKVLGELGHYSEAFMNGDFQKALAIATDKSSGPSHFEIKKHPVEISLEALSNPGNGDKNLTNTLKDMGDVSKASRRDGKLLAELPQPILEIEANIKVDLFDGSAKTIDGKALSAEQQKKLADFKASDSGQRILQEMAINSMEERIHLRQLEMDGKVASPSYAKFIAESPNPSPDQLNALSGKYDNAHSESGGRSAATMEQEAILALHDSDPQRWNAKNLRHHFGNQHADVREPLFKWLEVQEGSRAPAAKTEIKAAELAQPKLRPEVSDSRHDRVAAEGPALARNEQAEIRMQTQRLDRESTTSFVQDWKAEIAKKGNEIPESERRIKVADVAQQEIYKQIDFYLNQRRPSDNKSLADDGWRIYQACKDSPADHAKMDYILANEKTGKYHILDATAQDKNLTSQIRKDSIIKWGDEHLDGSSVEGKMLKTSGKKLVDDKIAELIAKPAPLDLINEPPPSLARKGVLETKRELDEYRQHLEDSSKSDPVRRKLLTDYSSELPGSQRFLEAKVVQDTSEHKVEQQHFDKVFGDKQIAKAVQEWLTAELSGRQPKGGANDRQHQNEWNLQDRKIKIQKETIEVRTTDRSLKSYQLDASSSRVEAAFQKAAEQAQARISEQLAKKTISQQEASKQRDKLFEAKRNFEASHDQIRSSIGEKLTTQPWDNMLRVKKEAVKESAEIVQEKAALKAIATEWKAWAEAISDKTLGDKVNTEVKDVIEQALNSAKGNPAPNQAEITALRKLIDGYSENNPAGIKKVHDFLKKDGDTKPLGRNEDTWTIGKIIELESKTGLPADPTQSQWLKNAKAKLDLEPDQAKLLEAALEEGKCKFALLDRKTLENLEIEQDILSFEQGQEVNSRAYSTGVGNQTKLPLQHADKYDPATHYEAALIVRSPVNGHDKYFVVNGCRRIHVFGSETTNPANRELPVLLFDDPKTFMQITEIDPRNSLKKATPFNFEVTKKK